MSTTTPKVYSGEEFADTVAERFPADEVPEVLALVRRWLARGDGAAVYVNEDLSDPRVGSLQLVPYGPPRGTPAGGWLRLGLELPQRLPDTGGSLNWRYQLSAVVKPGTFVPEREPSPDSTFGECVRYARELAATGQRLASVLTFEVQTDNRQRPTVERSSMVMTADWGTLWVPTAPGLPPAKLRGAQVALHHAGETTLFYCAGWNETSEVPYVLFKMLGDATTFGPRPLYHFKALRSMVPPVPPSR